ncbi:MAG: hypothetical protein OXE59_13285, partial [Bacteroidetes bacterium]|nr:hypothetical protein [Bacteroidota bacterium]
MDTNRLPYLIRCRGMKGGDIHSRPFFYKFFFMQRFISLFVISFLSFNVVIAQSDQDLIKQTHDALTA